MKVKDCMCNNVTCLDTNASIEECSKLMCEKHIGCIHICDTSSRQVVGIITDRDILLRTIACGKETKKTPVTDIMSCKVFSCTPDATVAEAEKIMSDNQVRRLPVIANNRIVGILTLGDLATNNNLNTEEVCHTLENICSCGNKNAE